MQEELDYSTLSWVKDEISESLKQIRQALELYAEGSSDQTQIRFCVTYLHQIYGTLHMVEIHGAALLTEEMELLAAAMYNGDVDNLDAGFDVLMRGLLQLPNYLEGLERGQADVPAVLIPLLNDLRAARDAPLMSENAFFSPDLSIPPPPPSKAAATADQDSATFIKRLRGVYQATLLTWLKDKNNPAHYLKLGKVVAKLEDASTTPESRQFWWIAGGLFEALAESEIEAGTSVSSLLTRIDKEIKRLMDEGEQVFSQQPPQELIKNCLYYVARANSQGPRVNELKSAFQLDDLILKEDMANQATDDLKGSNAEIMHNVYLILKDDLLAVKDRLDIFVRTQEKNLDELKPLAESLHRTADTLAMLGMADLRKICQDQAEILLGISAQDKLDDDSEFMNVASALLYVESTLDNLEIQPHTRRREESDSPDLSGIEVYENSQVLIPAQEHEQINQQVIHNARTVLSEIKDAFNRFETEKLANDEINDSPEQLLQVRGALSIMGLDQAATLISSAILFIRHHVIAADTPPTAAQLDTLADQITSIDYYLEAIELGRGPSRSVLKIAEISAEQLGYPSGSANEQLNSDKPVVPSTNTSVESNENIEVKTVPLTDPAEEATTSASNSKQDDEDRAEILEIFLEEATEVQGTIQQSLKNWSRNPDDNDALAELRRSFHTVKGSGRMAGAVDTGEFAWAIEDMLNRVIDGKLKQTSSMINLLEQAEAVLQALLGNLKGETEPAPDTSNIIDQVRQLISGHKPVIEVATDVDITEDEDTTQPDPENSSVSDLKTPVIPDVESEALQSAFTDSADFPDDDSGDDDTATTPTADTDPVLLDIFLKEANTHLTSLREYLGNITDSETALVSDEVYRALHTLHGSARMANQDSMTQLCQPMNYLARTLYQNKLVFGSDGIDTLRQFVTAIETLLQNIQHPNGHQPQYDDLLAAIEQQRNTAMSMVSQHNPLLSSTSLQAPPALYEPGPLDVSNESKPDSDSGNPSAEPVSTDIDESAQRDTHDPELTQFISLEDAARAFAIEADEDESAEFDGNNDYGTSSTADTDLLEIFLEEAEEIQEHTDQYLQSWSQDIDSPEPVANLQRALHTFKGSARMADITAIGDLAHAIESLLEGITEGRLKPKSRHPELLQRCHDWFSQALEQVKQHQTVASADSLLQELEKALKPGKDQHSTAKTRGEVVNIDKNSANDDSTAGGDLNEIIEFIEAFSYDAQEDKKEVQPANNNFEQVRVRAELLNELVNFSGEINIHNSRISQQLSAFQFNLTEMEQTINRLREQLRNFEILTETQMMYRHEPSSPELDDFDPLEMDRFSSIQHLSRGMVESLGDLTSIQNLLSSVANDSFMILAQQEKMTGELQDGLMRTRMVAFASIMPRLRRIVRQTGNDTHKQAKLSVTGGEGEMDRSQLTRLIPILEHLLRNAVDHGIEPPGLRKKKDKSENGHIDIDFSQRGSEVIIKISDDGAGINIDAIREKAILKGLMNEDSSLPDTEIMQFIFESGFSTAETVTQISGRGVGMDVVNTEIKQLGGVIHVESDPSQGTRFTISLPLTLLANQALMIEAGTSIYAIQLTHLEHVVRVSPDELAEISQMETPLFQHGDQAYHFLHLARVLQGAEASIPIDNERIPLLLLRNADQHVAIQVDKLLGREEIVIKSVGPQLSSVSVLSGATILPDGRIALILDIANLIRSFLAQNKDEATPLLPGSNDDQKSKERMPTVLIVDDSITVRKVTARLLGRCNYHTLTAKDGIDAIAEMDKKVPDVVLLDVEMPRMDGFELASHIRNDENLKHVPIIMITSRTGDKHRQHAMDIGASKYMGKPYQEKELLDSIAELTQSQTHG